MGEKVPDAWGASGTSPVLMSAAGGASANAGTPPLEPETEVRESDAGAQEDGGQVPEKNAPAEPSKPKIIFIPKPDPWGGGHARGGKALKGAGPGSFCRKNIKFTPTPRRGVERPAG